eukprot:16434934-Heterocapsa_arctica.AAC.1
MAPRKIPVEAVVANIITTATRYQNSNWIGLGLAWLVTPESQLVLDNSSPANAHQLWMDTARLTRRAKANMCKIPRPPELAKEAEEDRKKQTANLNMFKVFLPLPVAIDLNNLLAYKGKGTLDGKKPSDKSPWDPM